MINFEIDEIIEAMLVKSDNITYYLDKENEQIVHIDENIALEVENEYDEADTALEEWSHDFEDDDMYHENIFSPTEDVDEKELIKRIRFTHQDDYEPIPVLTLKDFKKITDGFLSFMKVSDDVRENIDFSISNSNGETEIIESIIKETGEKEAWDKFYEGEIRKVVVTWLNSLGYNVS